DRDRVARPGQSERQEPAVGGADGARTDQLDRVEDASHRPLAQRGVAVEGGGDRAARDRPYHQPAAGGGIAEIQHAIGSAEAADADPVDAPGALAGSLDRGTQGPHRLAGADHVVALEQPGNFGLADGERTDDQRPVRDRLVTGYAHAASERP